MTKRLFDLVASTAGLLLLSPIMMIAGLGICFSSRGPILYRARRVGKDGREFTLLKFRTMRVGASSGSAITARRDPRVFAFGSLLRFLKIDELPQLIHVLRGEMSIVGPRPEDPRIVAEHYANWARKTLEVPPGLTSPGSVYYYTHGEKLLNVPDPEGIYLRELLPIKLALDLVYLESSSLRYDTAIVLRTLRVLAFKTFGKNTFAEPPEMERATNTIERASKKGMSICDRAA